MKNGAQTQVDVLCTYHQVPNSLGLPAKSIFYDLSWQTHGITRLGPYSLDKDSLYVNGEHFTSASPYSASCYKGFQSSVFYGDTKIKIQDPNPKPYLYPKRLLLNTPQIKSFESKTRS